MDEDSFVMNTVDEIGGYFGIECGKAPLYHQDGFYLNLGRSALRYVVRALGIRRMHVPYYTCHTVAEALRSENCEPLFYAIDDEFLPEEDFPRDDFVLYNNYFGVMGANVGILSGQYPNLIVDNAQAYYTRPECRAAIYSPRKFFGLPDGGILVGRDLPRLDLRRATSWENSMHLLKRIDINAQAGYGDFVRSDENMENVPVLKMSKLTVALMGNIDAESAAKKRVENFSYIRNHLPMQFPFAMSDDDVPMVYPYMTNNIRLRSRLIQSKIYVASYWPGVRNCGDLQERIIPLPIDQRYDEKDMERIVEVIKNEGE